MKITKETLRQIIMEEIANEGVIDMGDGETVVTGPDGDASDEARGVARLEDAIDFLVQQEREDLAEPLRKIQDMLDSLR
tara:strand:- start:835 stop:1071 length:237 start_codon:yes stop_codon:yes gene_type:complete